MRRRQASAVEACAGLAVGFVGVFGLVCLIVWSLDRLAR
jgi:nitrate reductase NapE component